MKSSNITANRKEYFVKNIKHNYDKKNDLLYVYRENSKCYSNVVVGDFHIEFDKDGKVVGLEILKASEILEEYGISQGFLENSEGAELRAVLNNNSLLVFLSISSKNEKKSATITMNDVRSGIIEAIAF